MLRISILSLLLLLASVFADPSVSTKRTLDFKEVCTNNKNWTTLYLRAEGSNDTLHYLWDFGGKPSILMALTSPAATLNITCEDFLLRKNNSITFSQDPIYTIGIIINRIIEFNDVNDTAVINIADVTNINVLRPEFFRWSRKSLSVIGDSVGLDMEGNSYNDTAKNITRYGSIKLSLRGFCFLDHTETTPHMLHTENSTQVDFIFDNIQTNETFSNSRFAIELLMVGDGNPDRILVIDPKKSLDDEHTPGIFEVIEVRVPAFDRTDKMESTGGYLQWRPVSYVTASRDATLSTETIQYPPSKVSNRVNAVKNTMLYCYYGEDAKNLLVQSIIVSLGSKGDGFYKKTHYTTWTFIIGYGIPPDEQFSNLVIMIITIGLGLPLIIIFATGIYVCFRSMSKRHTDTYLNR
ncbi:hypothetical protein KPH14_004295 [Odynerus spinipes]|uniref:Glycosylated lysosomal membrane protein n=1 Tax=Odynerus spinipes TaxID=1348599 RepID=A0AAD9VW23_9HYME|nr:hypothetical protein KPH14_004295 [Odynerus spinipes]